MTQFLKVLVTKFSGIEGYSNKFNNKNLTKRNY